MLALVSLHSSRRKSISSNVKKYILFLNIVNVMLTCKRWTYNADRARWGATQSVMALSISMSCSVAISISFHCIVPRLTYIGFQIGMTWVMFCLLHNCRSPQWAIWLRCHHRCEKVSPYEIFIRRPLSGWVNESVSPYEIFIRAQSWRSISSLGRHLRHCMKC